MEIAPDRMTVYAWITGNPEELAFEDIVEMLERAGVRRGIDGAGIKELLKSGAPMERRVVARGKRPVDERDGELVMRFSPENKREPKILEDGSADYKHLGLVKQCVAGQELALRIMPGGGEDGEDVMGNAVPARKGKFPQPLPAGRNVLIGNDGKSLIAGLNGQVSFEGGKISVLPELVIGSDVDSSTGSIDFNGSVTILGGVRSGFEVKATEGIDIAGIVESAVIESGKSVALKGGIRGGGKGSVRAGGDVVSKFIESASIFAGGDIKADSILHSKATCCGDIMLSGKNGLLVGGKAVAGGKLVARTIGSAMATSTEVEVGHDPRLMRQYKSLTEQYKKLKSEMDKLSRMTPCAIKENMTEAEKLRLLHALQDKMRRREQLDIVQSKLNKILPSLEKREGMVVAASAIRNGVKIMIGNAVMFVKSDIHSCAMVNEDGRIAIKGLK
jgi:uncharacterized protein (DUF342 family)